VIHDSEVIQFKFAARGFIYSCGIQTYVKANSRMMELMISIFKRSWMENWTYFSTLKMPLF